MSCQTIYVMLSSFLSEEEKRIVAAHELGHITLHRSQLKMAPMSDNRLYNMINETEYQANLFAADLLIQDEDVAALSKSAIVMLDSTRLMMSAFDSLILRSRSRF